MSSTKPWLQSFAEREAVLLAPYAMFSVESTGRTHPESDHAYRGPFQRDRDRVLHSSAFRRLSGKMQVFTGDRGDYHRTRLTHTMEVSSVARTLARALRLNEDLIEAMALLHDIGHPPFGHAGEDALHDCLKDEGGFSHNQYALTVVEELEERYPDFPGLNLTAETLAGQRARANKIASRSVPLLETQTVDVADSITYNAHDIDDAVKLGIINVGQLSRVPLAGEALSVVQSRFTNLSAETLRATLVHQLIDMQVSAVVAYSGPILKDSPWQNHRDVVAAQFQLGMTPELSEQKCQLERYLYQHVYRHEQLLKMRRQGQDQSWELFDHFVQQPHLLPLRFAKRIAVVGLRRAVADYVAGMTDRFCRQQYELHCWNSGS
ncbi:MAG: dNTP triphosphohydrolase [Planctomycetales bacterium]|nr:dNTP triphosphohydrolase [Planctomycetales bacterium]